MNPSERAPRAPHALTCALAAILALCGIRPAVAQLPQARLYSIFPAGGKSGSTFELNLTTGADLDEANRLVFNHPGITALPKTVKAGDRQQPVPNAFLVTIGPEVPVGVYELHAAGLFGLTNPRAFAVGLREELRETEPNNEPEKPNPLPRDRTLNGTLNPATDVDYFRIEGKRGERILVTCRAADIDSRLSAVLELFDPQGRPIGYAREQRRRDPLLDVVLPADGAYLLKLHDFLYRGGPEYVYRLTAGSAPYIDSIVPPAGVPGTTARYTLLGRNLPGGESAGVTVDRHPLEKLSVEITLPAAPPVAPTATTLRTEEAGLSAVSYVLKSPAGESNAVLIRLAPSVPILEKEPNDTPATAQQITAPGEFAGRFQAPGDTDYVTFQARSGQVFYIEVFADRLGSTADPVFTLEQVTRSAKGEETVTRVISVDDENVNIAPHVFDTRNDDPVYRFQVPADGTYRIMLRDRSFESRGDPRMTYQLSIRPEKPDFQLVVLPQIPDPAAAANARFPKVSTWPIGLRKGDCRDVEILVLRRDGFREPIDVWAEGLPKGVSCRGATIAAAGKTANLIFTTAADAPEWGGLIRVFGKARVADRSKLTALADAEAALKGARQSIEKSQATAAKWTEAVRKAEALVATAKEAAAANPRDPAAGKALADLHAAAASLSQAAKAAEQGIATARKQLGSFQAARDAAEKAAAPQEVVHAAIPGTIVWSATTEDAAVARVGQSLGLSVMKESAPFQVSTDVAVLEVNQSRQILIPMSLAKRDGFQGVPTLKLNGLADGANVDVETNLFTKNQTSELVRMFVRRGARAGRYTLYWTAQAPVSYRRNLAALERAKTEQQQAARAAAMQEDAVKQAAAAREHAAKSRGALLPAIKNAKKQLVSARRKASAAEQAEESLFDRRRPLLVAALGPEAPKTATEALTAVERKVDEARASVKKEIAGIEAAQKAIEQAEADLNAAKQAERQADLALRQAKARSRRAATAKKAADRTVDQAAKESAPKTINDSAPSTPILLTIKPAPLDLDVTAPKGGMIKKGGQIELRVKLRRKRGFKGPVLVGFPLPPGTTGLKAATLAIPANKTTGVLAVTADAAATPGKPANLVVRAQMDFDGKAEVDEPVALTITK